MHAEVAAYITGHAHEADENGSRLVVRNGYHDERAVLKAAGAVMVRAPRVNDKRVDPESGARQRFLRRSCSATAASNSARASAARSALA